MIRVIQGDIFSSSADAIVNPVNCVGVMGKGLALQFKQRFPWYYKEYVRLCLARKLWLGKVRLHEVHGDLQFKWIVDFPTKFHWKESSTLASIFLGLESLIRNIDRYGVRSIAIPMLGCGEGGLDWEEVKPMILKMFENVEDVDVDIYEYSNKN